MKKAKQSLVKEIESFTKTAKEMDAKKRKDRLTYSEKDRATLAKKQSKILKRIGMALATTAGTLAVYTLFQNRRDLANSMTDISKALMSKLKEKYEILGHLLNETSPAVYNGNTVREPKKATMFPEPSFIKFLKRSAKIAINTHVNGFKFLKRSAKIAINMHVNGFKSLTGYIGRSPGPKSTGLVLYTGA
jgi:hypothetical protein